MSIFARVVFDTSTLVSAALRVGSVPHSAMIRAFTVSTVCASAFTLEELEQVLLRPKFDRYQPADVLISSDADLLVLHPWHDVPILTPAQFLK